MTFSSPSLCLSHKATSSSLFPFPEMRLSRKMPPQFHPFQQVSLHRARRCTPRLRAGIRPKFLLEDHDAVGHVDGLAKPVEQVKKVVLLQTKHEVFQLESEEYFRKEAVDMVERIFVGYISPFPDLAWRALTHSSYYNHLNQEVSDFDKLAIMGESVLKVLTAGESIVSKLYKFPRQFIFYTSAKNIEPIRLARRVVEHGFHYYLRHKIPGLMDEIDNFAKCMHKHDGLLSPPAVLPQIAHSLIGAVYLNTFTTKPMDDVADAFLEFLHRSPSD